MYTAHVTASNEGIGTGSSNILQHPAGRGTAEQRSDAIRICITRRKENDPVTSSLSSRGCCRSGNIRVRPTLSNGKHAGTVGAGVVPPIEITPTDTILDHIGMAVGPQRLLTCRVDLIAEIPTSHTESYRYGVHTITSLSAAAVKAETAGSPILARNEAPAVRRATSDRRRRRCRPKHDRRAVPRSSALQGKFLTEHRHQRFPQQCRCES